MPVINANPIELGITNKKTRVNITLLDDDENAIDADELELTVLDMGGAVLYEDDINSPPPGQQTRIIKAPNSTGDYYIDWGDPNAPQNQPNQSETSTPQDYCFVWTAVGGGGSEMITAVQVTKVVTPKTLRLIPYFRNLLDKAVKKAGPDCFLGYTDSQLLMYLEGGLQTINAYQPYPCFRSLDQFPELYQQLLLEAGLIAGVISQQLFAVDTDIPNYSDQGNAFVITHQQQLASFLNQISQRLDKLIPQFKWHFVRSGSVHIEAGPNFRLAQVISAAPFGATFRNVFFSG
jgi:hypothetical protein